MANEERISRTQVESRSTPGRGLGDRYCLSSKDTDPAPPSNKGKAVVAKVVPSQQEQFRTHNNIPGFFFAVRLSNSVKEPCTACGPGTSEQVEQKAQ